MRKSVLLLASIALAVLVACGLAVKQSTAVVTTYYAFVAKWGSFGSGNGQFRSPVSIATDYSSNVYVIDYQNQRIQKFTSNGTFLGKWGGLGKTNGHFNYPLGIATDSEGNVYVADTFNNRIQKFTSNGTFVRKWGALGSARGRFKQPFSVATDSNGNVYVTDTGNARIQKFTSNGTFITQWGSGGSENGQFSAAIGVATDPSGNVYVLDSGNARIQKFTSNGVFITKWGSGGSENGQFDNPSGIATDLSGNVYVADMFNNRIQKFTSNGAFITKWGSLGSKNGEFNGARGVATDSDGYVYVCEIVDPGGTGNNRIQKFAEFPLSADTVAPRVTRVVPAHGATGVALRANVVARFSEPMEKSTLNEANFKLFERQRNPDGSITMQQITNVTVTPRPNGLGATLDPYGTSPTRLAKNTVYKAVVSTGAKDFARNALDQKPRVPGSQPKEWYFRTSSWGKK